MKIINYKNLTDEQKEIVNGSCDSRKAAAVAGWGLDKLIYDRNSQVRAVVARHCHQQDLDVLEIGRAHV